MAIIINGTSGSITCAATIDATTITENCVSVANETQLWLKADNADVNTQLSMKANTADLKEIGVGQTWQDMTASRASGVTYTNTSGKPITVVLRVSATNYSVHYRSWLTVGGLEFGISGNEGVTFASGIVSAIVPNSTTYSYTQNAGNINFFELR